MLAEAPYLLITDDDRHFRDTLRQVFEGRGFRLREAADGEEALAILEAEPVHVAIVDLHMPRLTGLEVIRQTRRFNSVVPFILLSAAAPSDLLDASPDASQVFAFHSKPITLRRITQLVQSALRHAYPTRACEG